MNLEDQNEEKLIARAKDGDKYAFEMLIGRNLSILKGYILKLTCNKDLTEEILQETLLSAVIHIDSFTSKAKFSTWLIKIATNKYKDYLRRNKETDILLDIIPSSYSLEEEIINKEELEEVLEILKSMSNDKRVVFILKHYYGYSYEEISAVVNCPVGTVRSRLHYGIKEILSKFKGGR
ncbi:MULTISPECIES: RNA polymerase sigma factor SigY [Clostridium]|uniref:RNA polymerase sigma factor SigY n=1 Tax=Clostridium cibarium TaxID=2762247 RepID=A0ABR8PU65_9CLOT|nr:MULTISPECIES: RNA polymerase sigma factor SigY [Clostridium]MBD7911719.1 RNA polymerase sigma factor SigY [Clostridium cibarium]